MCLGQEPDVFFCPCYSNIKTELFFSVRPTRSLIRVILTMNLGCLLLDTSDTLNLLRVPTFFSPLYFTARIIKLVIIFSSLSHAPITNSFHSTTPLPISIIQLQLLGLSHHTLFKFSPCRSACSLERRRHYFKNRQTYVPSPIPLTDPYRWRRCPHHLPITND